jgi:hypothetical protein
MTRTRPIAAVGALTAKLPVPCNETQRFHDAVACGALPAACGMRFARRYSSGFAPEKSADHTSGTRARLPLVAFTSRKNDSRCPIAGIGRHAMDAHPPRAPDQGFGVGVVEPGEAVPGEVVLGGVAAGGVMPDDVLPAAGALDSEPAAELPLPDVSLLAGVEPAAVLSDLVDFLAVLRFECGFFFAGFGVPAAFSVPVALVPLAPGVFSGAAWANICACCSISAIFWGSVLSRMPLSWANAVADSEQTDNRTAIERCFIVYSSMGVVEKDPAERCSDRTQRQCDGIEVRRLCDRTRNRQCPKLLAVMTTRSLSGFAPQVNLCKKM